MVDYTTLIANLRGERDEFPEEYTKDAADAITTLRSKLAKAEEENAALREYVEIVTNGGTDYPETWDELQRLGIIVEVKPTLEYTYEWGDDCPMWVLAWKAERYTAIDAGEEK